MRRELTATGLPPTVVTELLAPTEPSAEEADTVFDRIVARYGALISVQVQEPPIDEVIIERLQPLMGIRFPNGHLFRKALQLSVGLGRDDPSLARILRRARQRPDTAEIQIRPIRWTGGSCGCGPLADNSG